MTQWEGAASFLLLTPTAKIKEFLLLSTLSSQISLSPAHIPDSVQAAGSWMVSLQILPACLQVITPDGPIYSASRFRTMVPWTRTCWTNAVRLLEFLHSSRLCVCVFILSCVQSCRIIQRVATAFRQTWRVWRSTCRMFLCFLQTWPGCKRPLTLITWPDSVFPHACCDSWCVNIYSASVHSVCHINAVFHCLCYRSLRSNKIQVLSDFVFAEYSRLERL